MFKDRPDILTPGRFYFASEDTPYYEGWHNFWNSDWTHNSEEPYEPPALGEDETLRRGYTKGSLGGPLPGAVFLGSPECLQGGEVTFPPPLNRRLPMGVDSRCYPPGTAPVLPPGGMLVWLTPEGVPAGASGTPMDSWPDSSLNKNTPLPVAPIRRPTILDPGPGGLRGARFWPTGVIPAALIWGFNEGDIPPPLDLGSEWTIYAAFTLSGPVGSIGGPALGGGPSGPTFALGGHSTLITAQTSLETFSAALALGPGTTHIFHVRKSTGNIELGVDGGAALVAPAVEPSSCTLGTITAYPITPANRRGCDYGEVLAYTWSMDDTNHRMVLEYLAARYGVTLP